MHRLLFKQDFRWSACAWMWSAPLLCASTLRCCASRRRTWHGPSRLPTASCYHSRAVCPCSSVQLGVAQFNQSNALANTYPVCVHLLASASCVFCLFACARACVDICARASRMHGACTHSYRCGASAGAGIPHRLRTTLDAAGVVAVVFQRKLACPARDNVHNPRACRCGKHCTAVVRAVEDSPATGRSVR